ncbi:MAG: glycoside hydrolase family 95 protein [Bacteroidales bacterium]|nr:glycoside hydrolase family 95 protein [Bacteroidales bacterium]
MRKLVKIIPVLACILVLSSCDKGRNSSVLVLHYDAPAEYFEEALPIGNGRFGAMVYGGTSLEKLSLNDITLWTGEPDKGPEHIDLAGRGLPVAGRLAEVREALDRVDYRTAEQLQKGLQGHFSESYQPLGNLFINHIADAAVTGYRRQLDIANATASVTYSRGGQPFKADYFASAPDSVIVISYESAGPMDMDISFETPQKVLEASALVQGSIGIITTDGYTAWHAYPGYYRQGEGQFLYDPERGIHFRTVVSVCTDDGAVTASEGRLKVRGAKRLAIKVVNATSFNGFDNGPVKEGKDYRALASANAAKVQKSSVSDIYKAHVADYQRLFNTFELYLGATPDSVKALPTDVQLKRYADLEEANPELEALYFQYGRYLLISSSRTRGVPANLQGLWNESVDPPWSCNYTTNINLEENYWPAEASGLGELHETLLDFLHNVSVTGYNTADAFYGIPQGWCLGHNTDIWAMSCPVGLGSGDPCWANWNMGGAWLSTHIWEHWLYTRDKERLRKDFPVLLGAARFCLDWLTEKDGWLLTSPSTSPENLYVTPDGFQGATLYGSTADIAIIRECLTDAVEASSLMLSWGFDDFGADGFIHKAQEALEKLLPYKIGADGRLQEWYHDWADADPRHRHQSHLIGVYPGHQILSGPLADAALKSLSERGFETTGWSCGWRINLYARLGDAGSAYKMFRRLLRYVSPDGYSGPDARRGGGTYPNLMDAHSPFQIDGNFGGTAGLLELFQQYSAGEGTSLSSLWPHGQVKGLRTRDGRTINIEW